MFEQSILVQKRTAKPWSVVLSLALELAGIGLLVVMPLIWAETLPALGLTKIAVWLSPTPNPPPVHQTPRGAGGKPSPFNPKVFVAPAAMPAHPNIINDPPADPGWTVFANSRGDRTGGIDVASLMAGIPGPPERQVVKQTPVPAAATKPVLIRVSHMEQAQILYKVMPVYPDIARRTRLSGVVNLVGIIATDGSIQSLRVIHGHPFLVNAAVEAVRQWRYKPTILNGQPVEVEAPIDVTFTLQ